MWDHMYTDICIFHHDKKIWSVTNFELVGSLPSAFEVRSIAVSSELIYLGCKGGNVEIWCKEKLNRVDLLQIGSNAKICSMAINASEDFLVVGTSDGQIQVFILEVLSLQGLGFRWFDSIVSIFQAWGLS